MTWTYSYVDLTTSLNKVRLTIGDTDSGDPLLTNEEIQFRIDNEATIWSAAASCADDIAAKFSRQVDKSVGDLRLSASQKVTQYRDLAMSIRSRKGLLHALPFAGGISVTGKETHEEDEDLVQPDIRRGIHDNPDITDSDDNDDD